MRAWKSYLAALVMATLLVCAGARQAFAADFAYWSASKSSEVYHTNVNCPSGSKISASNYREGTTDDVGNRRLCQNCAAMGSSSGGSASSTSSDSSSSSSTSSSSGSSAWTGYTQAELEAIYAIDLGEGAMYRMYNPNSGEHFYTADKAERNYLASVNWMYEGLGWYAPTSSNTPVYRLYNATGGEHHYTTDAGEQAYLILNGWTDEGIGWYSDDAEAVPLYRQYNPNMFACNHNYTADEGERDWLLSIGWVDEGIAWYGLEG